MKKKIDILTFVVLLQMFVLLNSSLFSQNNFNMTPPMGWEPWNFSHCEAPYKFNEEYYKKLADFFVSSGLRDLGYNYLTIECGSHYRDSKGVWQSDSLLFPKGFKPVIDYIHSRGLKVRAYTDAGRNVCCCNKMGSYSYYYEDAQRWVDLGFDGVKIDWCGGREMNLDPKTQYMEFKRAVDKTGKKDFHIEICAWGYDKPWLWGRNAGTIWRTESDIDGENITNQWVAEFGGHWHLLLRNIDRNRHPQPEYVGPGKGWNYPDMLEVGVPGGLNETEEKTMFSLWAIMASPLFLGNDVLNMPEYAKNILMNKEVIAIDQDKLGIQGDVVKEYLNGQLQIWVKPLYDGSLAVALFNRTEKEENISVNWADINMPQKCKVRNIWEAKDLGEQYDKYTVNVKSHETVLLKIYN